MLVKDFLLELDRTPLENALSSFKNSISPIKFGRLASTTNTDTTSNVEKKKSLDTKIAKPEKQPADKVAKPVVAKPVVAKPVVAKPVVAKPVVAKPVKDFDLDNLIKIGVIEQGLSPSEIKKLLPDEKTEDEALKGLNAIRSNIVKILQKSFIEKAKEASRVKMLAQIYGESNPGKWLQSMAAAGDKLIEKNKDDVDRAFKDKHDSIIKAITKKTGADALATLHAQKVKDLSAGGISNDGALKKEINLYFAITQEILNRLDSVIAEIQKLSTTSMT